MSTSSRKQIYFLSADYVNFMHRLRRLVLIPVTISSTYGYRVNSSGKRVITNWAGESRVIFGRWKFHGKYSTFVQDVLTKHELSSFLTTIFNFRKIELILSIRRPDFIEYDYLFVKFISFSISFFKIIFFH